MYYYISKKWTHKDDAFLTFWGVDHFGYQWDKLSIGKYNDPYEHEAWETVKSAPCKLVDPLFEEVFFDGKKMMIVANTKINRKKLGILKKDLHKKYQSWCPKIKDIDSYRVQIAPNSL